MVAGYKTWATNDIPTSAEVNGYLMSQCVPRFATVAARDAAITVPVLGQMAASDDYGEIYIYNGTLWVGAVPRFRYRSVTVTRQSATLTIDSDLQLLLEASSKYMIEWHFEPRAPDNTTDFQFDWNYTGTIASARYGGIFKPTVATTYVNSLSALDSFSSFGSALQAGLVTNNIAGLFGYGYISTTTSGMLSVRWARISGTNTIDLMQGSNISLLKVG